MIKERAEELVRALRSGEFQQTQYLLNRKNEGFCCLGVACELAYAAGKTRKKPYTDGDENPYRNGKIFYGGMEGDEIDDEAPDGFYDGAMPKSVMEHFGFKTSSGLIPDELEQDVHEMLCRTPGHINLISLANINDNQYGFAAIANIIEKHWEAL